MSLVITLRTPDGIVLASDTLTTLNRADNPPQGSDQPATRTVASFPVSFAASKVFPFLETFGVGTTGTPIIADKSVGRLLRELETELASAPVSLTVENAADKIGARIARSMKTAPDDESRNASVEFVVSGYEQDGAPKDAIRRVAAGTVTGSSNPSQPGLGLSAVGEGGVVEAFMQLARSLQLEPAVRFIALPDAVAFATFLIEATGGFQRFFLAPQTVGRDVDVGIIEPGEKFRWIRRASQAALK